MYNPLRRGYESGPSTNNNENFDVGVQPVADRLSGQSSSWKLEHVDFRLQMPRVGRNNSDPRHGRSRPACRRNCRLEVVQLTFTNSSSHSPHTNHPQTEPSPPTISASPLDITRRIHTAALAQISRDRTDISRLMVLCGSPNQFPAADVHDACGMDG